MIFSKRRYNTISFSIFYLAYAIRLVYLIKSINDFRKYIGRTKNNTIWMWNYFLESHWFDKFTETIFIEFTTYNLNKNLFSVVTLVIDRTTTSIDDFTIDYWVIFRKLRGHTGSVPFAAIC